VLEKFKIETMSIDEWIVKVVAAKKTSRVCGFSFLSGGKPKFWGEKGYFETFAEVKTRGDSETSIRIWRAIPQLTDQT
jgi:hypothetical protein